MKLLILGVGGHGRVCGEIATSQGWEVAFLDDNAPDVLGGLADYEELTGKCDAAFVAMGNPEVRETWTLRLKEKNYKLATFVSGKAMVSRTATIEEGCVVMAGAIVQSNCSIGRGVILSTGSIIDHDSKVGDYCHINAGAIVPSMSSVPNNTKINYGEVWRNV